MPVTPVTSDAPPSSHHSDRLEDLKMTRKFLLGTLTATLGFALAGGVMLAQRGNR